MEVGDPDGLFGHALSLVKKDFPAAKEFVEKVGHFLDGVRQLRCGLSRAAL